MASKERPRSGTEVRGRGSEPRGKRKPRKQTNGTTVRLGQQQHGLKQKRATPIGSPARGPHPLPPGGIRATDRVRNEVVLVGLPWV